MPPIVIDVVSDVVCPWCYLGKKRLEGALRAAGEVEVRWRPYQLDPTIPPEGLDRQAYMRAKFGDGDRLAQAHARLRALGAEVGVAFDFDSIRRSPNTLDAHRLIRFAAEAGAADALVERLFSDYFEGGRDIGDRAVLIEAATACGLDGEAVAARLASGEGADEVREEIEAARRVGVQGVPFFIFASKYAVSGAQSEEVLAQAIARAREDAA
ncbi:MAG: DsbA family oxidoreductase [Pseudomonadota bacterium]|nr:DsbA family oxidoreductase [Pseudomonadota bacterium]